MKLKPYSETQLNRFMDKMGDAFDYAKVIKFRNKLAHKKLVYGTRQSGHIKVVSSIENLSCDCSHCKEKLTKQECDALRKNLFEYYLFFNNLMQSPK